MTNRKEINWKDIQKLTAWPRPHQPWKMGRNKDKAATSTLVVILTYYLY